MRRFLAMLLVAGFSFSLIAPVVLAADPDAKLPPCCRRDGKHHCAMMSDQAGSPEGPSLRAAGCALFSTGRATPAGKTAGLCGAPRAIFAGLVGSRAIPARTEALCRSSYSRAGQKRGPPTPLS
jgi:hypothetical protein